MPASICVVGLWHLGSVAAACLADLGFQVTGVDENAAVVDKLKGGTPPLFEPGLEELVKKGLGAGRLAFTADTAAAVRGARYVWITYDTPVDDNDRVDLSPVLRAVRSISPHLEKGALVLVSSQVPVGTCDELANLIREARPAHEFHLAYTPENLRLGHAIQRFKSPDMLVLGADDARAQELALELFHDIAAPKPKVSLRTGEMVKHAINVFLATSVAYAGEIAMACDAVGADAVRVAEALRLDERIGPKARVFPGPGFAGGTLARDVRVLQALGQKNGYATPFVDAVLEVSDRQNAMAVHLLQKAFGSLRGLTFGVLGLTYTANTSTLRRALSVPVIETLHREGASVRAYDPKADRDEVRSHPTIGLVESVDDLARGADALVLLTEWPEFRALDFARLKSLMRRPLLVDAKNMFDMAALTKAGWEYVGIGRGRSVGKPEGART